MSEPPQPPGHCWSFYAHVNKRRITAHMAQLKATAVNNTSCLSDLTFRNVKKTVFYETHQNLSERKLPRDPVPHDRGQDHTEIPGCWKPWEQHGCVTGQLLPGWAAESYCHKVLVCNVLWKSSTKEVKLPHWEVQTETFWCFPCSTDADTLCRNTNKFHCLQGPPTNWPSSPCF